MVMWDMFYLMFEGCGGVWSYPEVDSSAKPLRQQGAGKWLVIHCPLLLNVSTVRQNENFYDDLHTCFSVLLVQNVLNRSHTTSAFKKLHHSYFNPSFRHQLIFKNSKKKRKIDNPRYY